MKKTNKKFTIKKSVNQNMDDDFILSFHNLKKVNKKLFYQYKLFVVEYNLDGETLSYINYDD